MGAKYKATISRATKQPKSEQGEPLKTERWDIAPLVALQRMNMKLECEASAAPALEALLVICPMIGRSETPGGQPERVRLAQSSKSEAPKTKA